MELSGEGDVEDSFVNGSAPELRADFPDRSEAALTQKTAFDTPANEVRDNCVDATVDMRTVGSVANSFDADGDHGCVVFSCQMQVR